MESSKHEKISKMSKIKSTFLELALNTTFQGVQNIARTDIRLLQVIWFICILISSCGCIYVCVKTLLNYLQYEVVTKITQINEIPSLFPVVTVN